MPWICLPFIQVLAYLEIKVPCQRHYDMIGIIVVFCVLKVLRFLRIVFKLFKIQAVKLIEVKKKKGLTIGFGICIITLCSGNII